MEGVMKKIFVIVLFFFGFTAFTITQASAGCNIVWSGSYSGSAPTAETSRTEQAAEELYPHLHSSPGTPQFTNNCYSSYKVLDGSTAMYWQKRVCISGSWLTQAWCRSIHPDVCDVYGYDEDGTWDVVCDNTTTTSIATTTTTAPATLINLSSFTATPKAGEIILEWSTESEIDNAGFNIYRAESVDGNYTKINTSLIPAQGSSTQGASYEFTDTNLQNRKTYYYKLEDIDLNGTSTMHGPVSATPRLIYGLGK
jgi:hypothetical protein